MDHTAIVTGWSCLVLTLATLATLIGLHLNRRQQRAVMDHRNAVPHPFVEQISLAAHQKAADYTHAKLAVDHREQLLSLALLYAWTLGGGLELLDHLLARWALPLPWHGVLFLLLFFIIQQLLELPLDLYRTFRVEARFGFNKMTLPLYCSDMFKQLLLMILFGAPLAWVMLTLMQRAGAYWWLDAWLVWSAFSLLMIWLFPTWIAPLFNTFSPLPAGEMKTRIEALLARCGFESNGLFVMDGSRRSSHGNAYFTGLGRAKRIVFFDTLLKQLTPLEAEAVLAHELGHFHHGHVKKRIVVMLLASLLGFMLLGWLTTTTWFYTGLGLSTPSPHAALALFMLVLPVFTFILHPLMNYFSRQNEFEADAYAIAHSSGDALVSALVKLYADNASTLTPDPLYSAWHDSHPPASVRIRHIQDNPHVPARTA